MGWIDENLALDNSTFPCAADAGTEGTMRWTKHSVAIALVATLLAIGSGTRGQAGQGPPVALRIWDFSLEQVEFHKQVAEEYRRLHPNITVEWRSIVQSQYNQALPLAFQSKQAPAPKGGFAPSPLMARSQPRSSNGGRTAPSWTGSN